MITIVLVGLGDQAFAGNLDPHGTGASFAYGENVGWINFKPAGSDGVTVTASAVTGFAWGENVGWINLSPATGGVVNDGAGRLSGFAWGENVGWINFAPSQGGVTIDAAGQFRGFAWGENIGWINFAPSQGGVTTSWRAAVTDTTAPVVTPPADLTVVATEAGGARGRASPALAAFLVGGAATDAVDGTPSRLSPQAGGTFVDDDMLFPLGVTTVTFRFQDDSGNVGTATSRVTVRAPFAVLALAKTAAPEPVSSGEALTYTVTVTNTGPDAANDVVVTDTLPAGVSFIAAGVGASACSRTGDVVTCAVGSLAAGASATATIIVVPAAAGTLSNTATATATEAEARSATASTTVQATADLGIAVTASFQGTLVAGRVLVYDFAVTSRGPDPATGVTITATLPENVTIVPGSGANCDLGAPDARCTLAGRTITYRDPNALVPPPGTGVTLPPGFTSFVGFSIHVLPTRAGSLTATGSVAAGVPDPNPADNAATAVVTVQESADLVVSLVGSPASLLMGSPVTYTATVTNNGPETAGGVRLTTVLSTTMLLGSVTTTQGTCATAVGSGQELPCDLGTLAPGASATVTIGVTTTTPATHAITASATATQVDVDATNNTATVSTEVRPAIFVDSFAQRSGSTGTVCTLGAAIHAANARAPVDGCAAGSAGGSTIVLPAGTYTLTAADNGAEFPWEGSQNALPIIRSHITLQGAGAETTIIERAVEAPVLRLFWMGGGHLALNDVTLRNGRASAPGGGAVYVGGSAVTINRSVLSDHDGAAITSSSYGGTLTVTDSTFSGNVGGRGGAISHTGPLSVTGSRFIANSVGSNGIGGAILHSGDGIIADSVFIGNTAAVYGGAIYFGAGQHTVSRSTFAGNTALGGGAMRGDGNLAVVDSVFSANTATAGGGGAIEFEGPVAITGSTFDGNTAWVGGALNLFGAHAISNSTFSGNSAGNQGGAVRLGNGTLAVNNVTVAGNHAGQRGGGFFSVEYSSITIRNSIVAGNAGGGSPECDMDQPSVGMISLGHNLIGNRDGCSIRSVATDQLGTGASPRDPLLGPLQDNGGLRAGLPSSPGPIPTHALLAGSPAIDAGSPASPGVPSAGAGLTIEAWINPSEIVTERPVVEWNDGRIGVHVWIAVARPGIGGGPGSLYANVVDAAGVVTSTNYSSAPGVIAAGAFQHVAMTYDKATGVSRLYRDGVVVAEASLGTFTPQTSLDLFLGARPPHSQFGAARYSGLLDEVTVYDRALTRSEILAIAQAGSAGKCTPLPVSGCVPVPAGLVGWWPGEGNADGLGRGNQGVLENGTTFAAGLVGQAFRFDGADDQVRIPLSASLGACEPTDQRGVARPRDGSICDVGAFELVVAGNHRPALTNPGSQTTAEGTTVSLAIVASDLDPDMLTYSASGLPAGLMIDSRTGLVTGPPGFTSAGAYGVTVTVRDGNGGSASTTFTWIVTDTNRPPVAHAQPVGTPVDTPRRIVLTGVDPDGAPLTFTIVRGPAHGTLTGTPPDLTYTPAPGFQGADSFTYTASDGQLTSAPATVSIRVPAHALVVAANTPPHCNASGNGVLSFHLEGAGPLGPLPSIPGALLSDPDYVAFNRQGELFVANRNDCRRVPSTIARFTFDGTTFVPNGSIAGNSLESVQGIAFNPKGELFAMSELNGRISRFLFDAQGNAVPNGTIATGATNRSLAFAPGGELFTTHNSNVVQRFRFDPATGAESPNGSFVVSGAAGIHGIAVSDRGELFLADVVTNSVFRVRFDEAGNPVANGAITVPGGPCGVAFTSSGELFAASIFTGGVSRFIFDTNGGAIPNGFLATASLCGVAGRDLALQTYDAQLQFDRTNNPSTLGPWSYGYYAVALGAGFTLYDRSVSATVSDLPVHGWVLANDPDGLPQVFFNPNGASVSDGPTVTDPVELNLHPGAVDGATRSTVLRFTAPAPDAYQISAVFSGNSVAGTTTDVHVLRNGTPIFDGSVVGFGTVTPFTGSQALATGDTLDFAVGDGGNGFTSDSTGVRVTITASGDRAPAVTNPGSQTSVEGATVSLAVTASDPDGDPLTYSATGLPAGLGIASATGLITGTVASGAAGTYTVTVTASDGRLSGGATFTWTVRLPNRPPAASPQSVTTTENTPITITLAGSDPDGDALAFTIVRRPTGGALAGTPPNLTYTPRRNRTGSDRFTFVVSDGQVVSAPAAVAIAVAPANDPPFFRPIADQQVRETSPRLRLVISGISPGPRNERRQTVMLSATSSHPGLIPHPTITGTGARRQLLYQPAPGTTGTATITVTADDGQAVNNLFSRTFTITVISNRPPTVEPQSVATVEDTSVAITLGGGDPDGDRLLFRVTRKPAHGTLTGRGGRWTYTPEANFSGADSFTVTGSDGAVTSAPATVTVTVTPGLTVRYAPDVTVALDGVTVSGAEVVQDDLAGTVTPIPIGTLPPGARVDGYHALVSGEQLLSFDVTVSLPGGVTAGPADVVRFDGTSYSLAFDAAAHGIPNGVNVDAVTVAGSDLLLSFDVTVSLPGGVVAGPADLVRFDGTTFTLFLDGRAAGVPPGLDLDAAHHVESTGRLLLSFDGAGRVGSVDFTRADVLELDPATSAWRLAVDNSARREWTGANLTALWATASRFPALARPSNRTTPEGRPVSLPLVASDPDGQRLTFSARGLPAGLDIDPATGRITGAPTFTAAGTHPVTVTASDGVLSRSKTFTWTVTNTNRSPVAESASITTPEDTPVAITLAGSDLDGDALAFAVTGGPAHGTLAGTGAARTYTPAANFSGADSFTFTARDGAVTSEPATVSITVTPGLTLRYAPDITVALGGRTVSGAEVVQDDLAGTVTPITIGTFPPGIRVDGYHRLTNGDQLLSFDVTVSLPGEVTAGPADVVRFDGTSYSLFFDAAANGIPNGVNVDAVGMIGSDLLLSFDVTVALPGGVTAGPADLLRVNGSTYTLFFDGKAAGVPAGLDLDAAHYLESAGLLLLSFDGSGSLGGVTFGKADVLEFNPTTAAWRLAVENATRTEWTGASLDALWAVPSSGGGPL